MIRLACKSCGADAIVTYSANPPRGFRPGCAHYPGCPMKGHEVEREPHVTAFDAVDAWQAIHQPHNTTDSKGAS